MSYVSAHMSTVMTKAQAEKIRKQTQLFGYEPEMTAHGATDYRLTLFSRADIERVRRMVETDNDLHAEKELKMKSEGR